METLSPWRLYQRGDHHGGDSINVEAPSSSPLYHCEDCITVDICHCGDYINVDYIIVDGTSMYYYGNCMNVETVSWGLYQRGDCFIMETVSLRTLYQCGDCIIVEIVSTWRLSHCGDCINVETVP